MLAAPPTITMRIRARATAPVLSITRRAAGIGYIAQYATKARLRALRRGAPMDHGVLVKAAGALAHIMAA